MVRIRKNAQTLPAPERDRFLAALGTLNAQGHGAYRDFRDMHTAVSNLEMHGNVGFLPWHRTYVLDLERALQAIDPTVAVPYWRFDEPAPDVFTRDFMGESDPQDQAVFRPGHALEHWFTDGQLGIIRGLDFPPDGPAKVMDEFDTMALGTPGDVSQAFTAWKTILTAMPTLVSRRSARSPTCRRRCAIRYFSCCTPMSIDYGPNGSG